MRFRLGGHSLRSARQSQIMAHSSGSLVAPHAYIGQRWRLAPTIAKLAFREGLAAGAKEIRTLGPSLARASRFPAAEQGPEVDRGDLERPCLALSRQC